MDTVQNVIFSSEKLFFGPVRNGPKLFGQFQNHFDFRLIKEQGISFLIHKIKIEKIRKEQKSSSTRCDILRNLKHIATD